LPPDTAWPGPRSHAALLAVLAVLLSVIGWTTPGTELLRPLGFAFGGCACLLMWWQARGQAVDAAWQYRRPVELASAPVEAATAAEATPQVQPHQAPDHWQAGVLHAIDWRRFEALCEALFRQEGYLTSVPPRSADSGVDLFLHSAVDPDRIARVLQCLHWSAEPVGVAALRSLRGAMADAGVDSGLFVTTASFAPEARSFAQRNGITPVDGADLLLMLVNRPELQQRQLLAVATQGEYWRPTCALCGEKMVRRRGGDGPRSDWDCSAFPRCSHTLHWPGGVA
jgi:restriction system protein